MKLTKKEYANRKEELKDYWLGVVIFIALQTLISLALLMLARIQGQRGAASDALSTFFHVDDLSTFIYVLSNPLPYLINLGLLLYFAFTRRSIALGMLTVFGLLFVFALVAGMLFAMYCFVSAFSR